LTGIERNKSLQDFSCYKWYLDFLDSFIQIKSSGFLIQNRLHAQSIAYSIVKENPPDEWDKSQKEEFLLWRDGHLSDLLEEESTLGDSFDILSIEDRIKALRYIRRGQDKFRKSVFDAYKGPAAQSQAVPSRRCWTQHI
jgi:hypothetical protein